MEPNLIQRFFSLIESIFFERSEIRLKLFLNQGTSKIYLIGVFSYQALLCLVFVIELNSPHHFGAVRSQRASTFFAVRWIGNAGPAV